MRRLWKFLIAESLLAVPAKASLAGGVIGDDINHAEEYDLEVILGVANSAVLAIVARREAKPFKDLADLETIAGLDKPAREARKRLIFLN